MFEEQAAWSNVQLVDAVRESGEFLKDLQKYGPVLPNIRWITKVESLGANVERTTQLTKGKFSATRHEAKVAKGIRR
jgi:hypothetical protein